MKILSIDLDWLFLDCPEYQKYMDCEVDFETSWRVIKAYLPDREFKPCPDSLAYLRHILRNSCKDAKIDIISEHDEILNILRENEYKNAEVINFDHHHDITYGDDDYELSIENWVLFGRKENLIKDYSWIHQDNSKLCLTSPFNFTRESWKDVELEIFDNIKFDHVVFCISKHFTPPEYHHLALLLKGDIVCSL
ncbi:MAG: hypothetical protein ACRDDH_09230 [Cetobacterium sp.]|uniref:hypothetical protein n=1 Tax=Cetobacterium sp. TaxID=2071632 RepID=UPI003EE4A8C9